MNYKLFDNHTHITDRRFEKDFDEVIKNARKNSVTHMIIPSTDLQSAHDGLELASKYDDIYIAVGTHPHEAKHCDVDTLKMYEHLAKTEKKVVAIGEIGLDYYYDHSPRDIQKAVFIEQIRLAKTLNLPIVIHSRDAHGDTMEILTLEEAFDTGVIMHCYSGSAEMARQYVKKGAYISFSGTITYKNATKIKEAVEVVPMDRILIETDAPYLTPTPHRGKRNEPAYVYFTCMEAANLKGVTFEEMANATFENTFKAYRIDKK